MSEIPDKENTTEQMIRELVWLGFRQAQNANRLYPDNKHTFADHSDYLMIEGKKIAEAARHHLSQVAEENRKLKLFSKHLLKAYDDMVEKFSSEVSLGLEYVKEILGPRNAMESVLKETQSDEHPSSLTGDAVEFLNFVVKEKFQVFEGGFWARDNEEGKFNDEELYKLFLSTRSDH